MSSFQIQRKPEPPVRSDSTKLTTMPSSPLGHTAQTLQLHRKKQQGQKVAYNSLQVGIRPSLECPDPPCYRDTAVETQIMTKWRTVCQPTGSRAGRTGERPGSRDRLGQHDLLGMV